MRNAICLSLTAFVLGLPACGGKEGGTSPTDGIPDAAALTLEVTGGAQERGTAALVSAGALAGAPTWPATGDDLAAAQARIAAVNAALRQILDHVSAVAAGSGLPLGSGQVYGPAERCTVEVTPCPAGASATFRLWIGRAAVAGHGGAFVLQAKPLGAADAAYATVLAGWMRRGDLPRRGAGQMWIDLDRVRAAVPAFDYPGQGTLYGGFAAAGEGDQLTKAEVLRLRDFTPDRTTSPAATVAYRGFRTAAGTARVRVAALKDDYGAAPSAQELNLAHVVYDADLGGRAYALVAGGDVASGTYFLGRACYAPHDPSAPIYKEWFSCSDAVGPARCIADAGGAGTPATGFSGSWPSSCSVAGALAPPDAETGSATTPPDALPGEDGTGLTPEDAPVSDTDAPTVG